jgi:hypothetical protein
MDFPSRAATSSAARRPESTIPPKMAPTVAAGHGVSRHAGDKKTRVYLDGILHQLRFANFCPHRFLA